jgi:hypothetical protein
MAKRTYSDEQRQQAREIYEVDGARAAAKVIGCSTTLVRNWAKEEGWTSCSVSIQNTQAANAKVRATFDERRLELAMGFLEDAQEFRSRLFEPTNVHAFGGKELTFMEREIAEPIPADKVKLMTAAAIAVDKAMALDSHGKPTKIEINGHDGEARIKARELAEKAMEELKRKAKANKARPTNIGAIAS